MDIRSHMNLVENAQVEAETKVEQQVDEGRFSRFRDMETAAQPAPEATQSPKAQGWECAHQGGALSDNPHPKGSQEAHQWEVGYQDYFFNESVTEDIRAVPDEAQAALRALCNEHGMSQTLEALAAIVMDRNQRAASLIMQASNVIRDQG